MTDETCAETGKMTNDFDSTTCNIMPQGCEANGDGNACAAKVNECNTYNAQGDSSTHATDQKCEWS